MSATPLGSDWQVGLLDPEVGFSLAKSLPRTYKLALQGRLHNLLSIAICSLVLLCLAATALAIPMVLILVPFPGPARGVPRGNLGFPLELLGTLLGDILVAIGFGFFLRMVLLKIPVKITINVEHEIELSTWFRTTVVRVQDLISIQAGSWSDRGHLRGDPSAQGWEAVHAQPICRLPRVPPSSSRRLQPIGSDQGILSALPDQGVWR